MLNPSLHNDQLSLFEPVLQAYECAAPISNAVLYDLLASKGTFEKAALQNKAPVGASGDQHNLVKRKIRWIQQSLKQLGAIERVPGQRGVWRLKPQPAADLQPAVPNVVQVSFSTHLGLALWSDAAAVFSRITEPLHLILTSPPYPLRDARAYGNPTDSQFPDFICAALEPLVAKLLSGGSLCLNISNDIFMQGSPARSLYIERTVLALHDRLGLFLQDRIIWDNPTKPPGPTTWACRTRQQLVHTYEAVLWFTNDPAKCFADNRRVLVPHRPRHATLIKKGGEHRTTSYGDGAHQVRPGSFGAPTVGTIPRNILRFPHSTGDSRRARSDALACGLPAHGATMPIGLAKFLVQFTTPEDGLVADPFAGWFTTALAAEQCGRRWIASERMAQYTAGAALRFNDAPGFSYSFDRN